MTFPRVIMVLACSGLPLLAATPSLASEDGFWCPKSGHWVSIGDSESKVLKKCGPPQNRKDVLYKGCTDSGLCYDGKVGERWTYDFGSTYLVRFLLFQDDRLTLIEEDDYGEE